MRAPLTLTVYHQPGWSAAAPEHARREAAGRGTGMTRHTQSLQQLGKFLDLHKCSQRPVLRNDQTSR